MIDSPVIPVEIQRLADDVAQAIIGNAERFAAAQGESALVARREAGGFGHLTLKATTLVFPAGERLDAARINRLAADARAKILADAALMGPAVRVVTVRIHSRGQGYSLNIGVEF